MHFLKDSCFLDSRYQCKDVFEVRDVWAVVGGVDTQSSPWMSFPKAAASWIRLIKVSTFLRSKMFERLQGGVESRSSSQDTDKSFPDTTQRLSSTMS